MPTSSHGPANRPIGGNDHRGLLPAIPTLPDRRRRTHAGGAR